MKVEYNNKKIALPFNFGGESIELPGFAAAVYDYTMYKTMEMEQLDKATKQQPGFSDNQDGWQIVRNGLNFFRQYFAKEYMVLLD